MKFYDFRAKITNLGANSYFARGLRKMTKKIHWTEHSKIKMRQYGLSKSKLINLIYKPERKERGIVPGTVAVMKTNKIFFSKKKIDLKKAFKPQKAPGEIWLMFKDTKDQRKIISAWRYPGITKAGEAADIIAKYSD